MFSSCRKLKSLNLTSFKTSKVKNMSAMFMGCSSLSELNLYNFRTHKVLNMRHMFDSCTSLKKLDISRFITVNVRDMSYMFSSLSELTSIDLNNFETPRVTDMSSMFYGCKSLKQLNLKSFRTYNLRQMTYMFYKCESLTSLDLSNFNTSSVVYMDYMFAACYTLEYLEISNFITVNVKNMEYMFYATASLISLDLKNFETIGIENSLYMFSDTNEELIYCINETKTSLDIINLLIPFTKNCPYFCFIKSQKSIYNTIECINNCSNHQTNKYEYNNICYQSCTNGLYYDYSHSYCIDSIPEGYYLDDESQNTIDKCHIKCNNCSKESMINELCITCNNSFGYYKKYDLNQSKFINCYKGIVDGYYFDEYNEIYIPCFSSCKNCGGIGNKENNK
jgi:surface protein